MGDSRDSGSRKTLNPPPASTRHWATKFRAEDDMGALHPHRAELDDSYSRGYADGAEEARADNIDRWRTVLLTVLESKFGVVEDEVLDRIGESAQPRLERWLIAAVSASSLEEVVDV